MATGHDGSLYMVGPDIYKFDPQTGQHTVAIPSRNLLATANEVDLREDGLAGSHVMIYERTEGEASYPQIVSDNDADGHPIGWAALSGAVADAEKPGTLYAVSDSVLSAQPSIYTIDATTGAVTLIKDLSQSASNFTSLSYVPADINDPNSDDILVSANSFGDVFQLDPSSGTATQIGNYGTIANQQVGSSGDIVAVRGLGIYATVDVGTTANSNDYLAVIDPATWTATPLGTGTGFNNIFGLGYWAGKFYGFVDDKTTHTGRIIEIDPNTGKGTEILSGAQEWYGAGVTTAAPIQ